MGRAFVSFVVGLVAAVGLVAIEAHSSNAVESAVAQLGVVATTLFAVGGALCGYRAVAARARTAGVIAMVLLGPGAAWSWLAFVDGSTKAVSAAGPVVLVAATLAIVLLQRGLRSARWLEVFCGLGSLGLAVAASAVRVSPDGASSTASLALLVALAGMTCLYGLLVDIEVAAHRSLQHLVETNRRMADEVTRTEDLLHDLRSGLLSIEAAVGSSSVGLAGAVGSEAARLRRLTVAGSVRGGGSRADGATADDGGGTDGAAIDRPAPTFDLAAGVRAMVATRRAAGVAIELWSPPAVLVRGDESELLAVIDNLVANADRHGRAPIVVEIAETGSGIAVSVTDTGRGPAVADSEWVFERGVSTHPHGSGLGLSRARELARRNGGEVVAERPPCGARFVMRLPAARSVGAA